MGVPGRTFAPAGKPILGVALWIALLGGCVDLQQHERTLAILSAEVQALESRLAATNDTLLQLEKEQQLTQTLISEQLGDLNGQVAELPRAVSSLCAVPAAAPAAQCDSAPQPVVVFSGDNKMVVGELERVWIEPPGSSLIARVDTGAHWNSLHAGNLVEFERDGDDWVRFELILNDEVTTLEREVARYVRVYQQADPDGTRRPVVELRLRLGEVQNTFEFTLADRAHLDYQMLLGRNFLTDMALVDVGRQFIQPQYKPERE